MDTLNAIENFPMPPEPTITDIRAWFGLVNQIAPFFATTSTMQPFRDLLKSTESKNKKVFWNETGLEFAYGKCFTKKTLGAYMDYNHRSYK